ncbi:energy-coupling factor transporter ATPase [Dendrosporobacter sp. 1207_IL3150]|uniref:energy-coupling factor transporter ATPase n=1 Tax=Dendrosporobacter sp. 1207_IL3150 TaxID=3084054 RepID=UPI002FD90B17
MGDFIKVENLCHAYTTQNEGETLALDNINLTIKAGEFVAIIGTNGSGKSTLAKHFNALLLPTSGECLVNGMSTNDSKNLWDIRQIVGMVFQNPDNQLVATVVEEDVAFGPENLGVAPTEIAKRVDKALEMVGMTNYRLHGPHLLSGGQKQRIAIAGVLAMQSKCLVLDEPTAMLDPQGRQEVLQTVRELHAKSGITVIYITHFMEEAAAADKVVVMNQGKIIHTGKPNEVFNEVKMLKELGLDVPIAAEVAERLRDANFAIPDKIITDDELVVALCQ